MGSYHYKLTMDAVQFSEFNHNDICAWMAVQCRDCSHDQCTIGYLTCPFQDKTCYEITKEDWMKVLVPSTMENSNE